MSTTKRSKKPLDFVSPVDLASLRPAGRVTLDAAKGEVKVEAVGRPAEGFGDLPVLVNGLHLTLAEETPGVSR